MQLFYKNKWTNAEMSADKVKAVIKVEGYIGIPQSWYYDDGKADDIVATKEEMAKEIKNLKNLKVEEIDVHINSYGGDVNHGISMYEALLGSGAVINVKIFGFTASIATVIAMAAPIERRKASVNAFGLVHEGRGGQWGVSSTIRQYADFLDKVNDQIADIYSKSTKLSKEEAKALMSRANGEGEWLTASEMKDIGLISDTFEPLEAAASFAAEINACGFLPKLPVPAPAPTTAQAVDNLQNAFEKLGDSILNKIKDLFPNNSKNNKNMSKPSLALAALCAVLAVEKIEITDDGCFLNQDQMKAIDAAIAKAAADLTAAQAAATTAQADNQTAMAALDAIDTTVASAATLEAKVTAIKTKLAAKPGANPSNHGGGDNNQPSADGANWDIINNLPHNKAVDDMII